MKKRLLRFVVLCLTAFILTAQTAAAALAPDTAFDDVPPGSPWYESIHYISERDIAKGTGSRTFSPDTPVTTEQWAIMLWRAYGKEDIPEDTDLPFGAWCLINAYQHRWISLPDLADPNAACCRAAICESVCAVIHVPTAHHDLCGNGTDPGGIVTRGEAAFILHKMLTGHFEAKKPQADRPLSIQNPSKAEIQPFISELRRVPPSILRQFQDAGWIYSVDSEYLDNMSARLGTICIGATSYTKKHIYVSQACATLHEFGHFLDGALGFPSKTKGLYQSESASTAPFLRDYARENHYEYFAEYFVYWLEHHEKPEYAAQMEELTPQTYHFFCETAENNWLPPLR